VGGEDDDAGGTALLTDAQAQTLVGEDYFAQARLSRQQARDEAVSILQGTVESASVTEDAREAAGTDIAMMAENAMVESRIENLVIAKGYRDCVAFVDAGDVNVIISKTANGLTDSDVAKIRDIVMSEAAITNAEQIKIIETT
jgi:stage III sporulation protein AH